MFHRLCAAGEDLGRSVARTEERCRAVREEKRVDGMFDVAGKAGGAARTDETSAKSLWGSRCVTRRILLENVLDRLHTRGETETDKGLEDGRGRQNIPQSTETRTCYDRSSRRRRGLPK